MTVLRKIHRIGILTTGLLLCVTHGSACYYDSQNFSATEKNQTTVNDIFTNKYVNSEAGKVAVIQKELSETESKLNSKPDDIGLRNLKANLLARLGKRDAAIAEYSAILAKNPNDYSTLCNYAMALQSAKNYDHAVQVLGKAYAGNPDLRSHAELFHIDFLKYEKDNNQRRTVPAKRIFIDSLTPLWEKRGKGTEANNFSLVGFPDKVHSTAIAELVRQFPERGELWHVFAMTLEHEKDFSHAVRAYDNAVKYGSPYKTDITGYLLDFRPFAYSKDPARSGGMKLVWTIVGVVVFVVLLVIGKILWAVFSDIKSVSDQKKEELEREKRKREKS